MRFSIITPTYREGDLLTRAVESLVHQTYKDWEMIIVNDSPFDSSYLTFASSINDARIHYRPNETRRGANYSKNKALRHVSADSKWVIFLKDTDYLAPDTLATLHELILVNQEKKWFVTNHAHKNGTPITKFPKTDNEYFYARDCLLLHRGRGDATHCIETKLATSATFPKHFKQGEEWFYFYQIGQQEKLYYHDHNSTVVSGREKRKRTRGERFEEITKLLYEGAHLKLLYRPTFLIYIFYKYIGLIRQ